MANGEYRCRIVPNRTVDVDMAAVIHVGAPAILEHAVDSAEAFDGAAHAALSFASADGWPVDTYAAYDDTISGWLIRRIP
jgi:hypothetical protein